MIHIYNTCIIDYISHRYIYIYNIYILHIMLYSNIPMCWIKTLPVPIPMPGYLDFAEESVTKTDSRGSQGSHGPRQKMALKLYIYIWIHQVAYVDHQEIHQVITQILWKILEFDELSTTTPVWSFARNADNAEAKRRLWVSYPGLKSLESTPAHQVLGCC